MSDGFQFYQTYKPETCSKITQEAKKVTSHQSLNDNGVHTKHGQYSNDFINFKLYSRR